MNYVRGLNAFSPINEFLLACSTRSCRLQCIPVGWAQLDRFFPGQRFHYIPEELLFIDVAECGSYHVPLCLFICAYKVLGKNIELYPLYHCVL